MAADIETAAAAYLQKPYHVVMVFDRCADGNDGWVAWVQEWDGAIGQENTPDAAVASLRGAMGA